MINKTGISIVILLALVFSSGCQQRQIKKTIYNIGNQSDCVQATRNLPDSDQRKQDCILEQNKDRPSFDEYEKQREEILKDEPAELPE